MCRNILVLLYASLLGGVTASVKGPWSNNGAWPCPASEDIWPCQCSLDHKDNMDMDCSAVTSEDQLAVAFKAHFPNPNFRKFILYRNDKVKVLRAGTLGNTTYQQFWVTEGALETVEEQALSGSSDTALYLVFNFNSISTFPFGDLPSFLRLASLDLRHNALSGFPKLKSDTLKTLYLSYNPLGCLPVRAFDNTPAMKDLQLTETEIPWIPPGIFSGLQQLSIVALGRNHITYLDDGALQCGPNTGLIDLGLNEIRRLAPDVLKGQSRSWIYMHHNRLTRLDEEVWKPFFDRAGTMDPVGDPLHCGCELAWILRRPAYLRAVDKYSTCANGKLLRDLNPRDYDHC